MNVSDERCFRCGAGVTGKEGVYCGDCREAVLIQYSALGGNIGSVETEQTGRSERDEGRDGKKEEQEQTKEEKDAHMKQTTKAEQVKGGLEETVEEKSAVKGGVEETVEEKINADHDTTSNQGERKSREKVEREPIVTSMGSAAYEHQSTDPQQKVRESWYIHQLQVAVSQAERQLIDQLTHAQIMKLGPSLGEMGSVCIGDTSIYDILMRQEVSNKTLSYIPLRVSAVSDDDYVMKFLAMVEQKMDREKLPLKDRPAMTVTVASGESMGENILGYVDPGAAHTVIKREVVEKSGIKVFHDVRAQAMSGFGGRAERPQGFCFLVN